MKSIKIKRSADFPTQRWEREPRAKADFLADKFEEECERRGVNPEHPRLEGYVFMDGKVPRLAVRTTTVGGASSVYKNFNRNQIPDAVDCALSCIEGLERGDRQERKIAGLVDQFEDSFEVYRDPGSFSFLLHPRSGSKARMNVEVNCSFHELRDGVIEYREVPDVFLTLKAYLSPEGALAFCEEALHNAKKRRE